MFSSQISLIEKINEIRRDSRVKNVTVKIYRDYWVIRVIPISKAHSIRIIDYTGKSTDETVDWMLEALNTFKIPEDWKLET